MCSVERIHCQLVINYCKHFPENGYVDCFHFEYIRGMTRTHPTRQFEKAVCVLAAGHTSTVSCISARWSELATCASTLQLLVSNQ